MPDLMTAASPNDADYSNRAPRWACDVGVIITDDCGQEMIGRLGNISNGGFMAECETRVRLGSIVSVELPERGRVHAEVRWVLGWRFGAMILPN